MSIKVFIVDDSSVARTLLSSILADDKNIEIVGESGSYQGGIIMLDEAEPDVVMLKSHIDGQMKINEVIKSMKKVRPETKIIICTNPNKTGLIVSASDVGADDFVSKPYNKQKVLRIIREVVGHE